MQIYNCHIHTLTIDHVPEGFLPLKLQLLLAKYRFGGNMAELANDLIPFTDDDFLGHYAAFLQIGTLKDQQEIFENILRFYPDGTKFVIHSLDLEYMGCGTVKKSFIEQLDELAKLKQRYPEQVLPFIFADPRRINLIKLVQKYVEEHGFCGIKIYPSLGYYPDDTKLNPIWRYAEKNDIPVTAHCSKGGIYYMDDDLKGLLKTCHLESGKNKRELCNNFTHPNNYISLLQKFPKLKICLAHFGGEDDMIEYLDDPPLNKPNDNWYYLVKEMLKKYDNIFTDIAYTLRKQELFSVIKVILQSEPKIREKIMFASDYYMVQQVGSEKRFSVDLRAFFDEKDFQQIAEINPKRFLY